MELTKNLKCISLRNGLELWLEDEYISLLKDVLLNATQSKFIEIGDQIINTADITGVFTPATMAEHTKRKNGQWQCNKGTWHDKGSKCECRNTPEYFVAKTEYKKLDFDPAEVMRKAMEETRK